MAQHHANSGATIEGQKASVESMPPRFHPDALRSSNANLTFLGTMIAFRHLLAISAISVALFFLLGPKVGALAVQSNADTGSQQVGANTPPPFSAFLQPALDQVGTTVSQLQIDHWKLPKDWKSQLHGDAQSIQQDLAQQLPSLFAQMQASPTSLDAQMRLMQNVNALYDVLVRLTVAANLTDKKNDAAMLTNALRQLESARKTASDQLLHAVSLQDQKIVHLQSQLAEGQATEHLSPVHAKTIIVDNDATHHRTRRRTAHRKQATPTAPPAKPKPQ
ncbi:MAG: hypothetical protein ABI076_11125 [Acidobacteriaceae bacterium]